MWYCIISRLSFKTPINQSKQEEDRGNKTDKISVSVETR